MGGETSSQGIVETRNESKRGSESGWTRETIRDERIIESRRAEGLWRQNGRWSDTKCEDRVRERRREDGIVETRREDSVTDGTRKDTMQWTGRWI